MRLSKRLTEILLRFIEWHVIVQRRADVAIGGRESPYLLRWYAIPRNRFLNIYVHELVRSDDDRAHHDHPWWWVSVILDGEYVEETVRAGGVREQRSYRAGSIRVHGARYAHRLILPGLSRARTLFITGPKIREWGFHCPRGWRHWREFTDPATEGATLGRGCE